MQRGSHVAVTAEQKDPALWLSGVSLWVDNGAGGPRRERGTLPIWITGRADIGSPRLRHFCGMAQSGTYVPLSANWQPGDKLTLPQSVANGFLPLLRLTWET